MKLHVVWWLFTTMLQQVYCISCSVCLDRSDISIQVLLYGNDDLSLQRSMETTAISLGISLNVTPVEDLNQFIQKIQDTLVSRPDALVVSIPTDEKGAPEVAIKEVMDAGIPVVTLTSFNSSSSSVAGSTTTVARTDSTWLASLGIDDSEVGRMAAKAFHDGAIQPIRAALFVYSGTLPQRVFEAFQMELFRLVGSTTVTPQVESLNVDQAIDSILNDCLWDVIFWAAGDHADLHWTCSSSLWGAILMDVDESDAPILEAVRDGRFLFAISKQVPLQTFLSVVLSTLYVTTGQLVAATEQAKQFITSPILWNISNIHQDSHGDVPFTGASKTRAATRVPKQIGWVMFDEDNRDVDPIYMETTLAAATQAAQDFSINLQIVRAEMHSKSLPSDDSTTWLGNFQNFTNVNRNRNTIWEVCGDRNSLDGIVISLPLQAHVYPPLDSQRVVRYNPDHFHVAAIQRCLEHDIPVIAVRGYLDSTTMAIKHQIRPNLYSAGYQAGQEFARLAKTDAHVWCLFTTVTANACVGLFDAVQKENELSLDSSSATTNHRTFHYMEDMRMDGDRLNYFTAIVQAAIHEAGSPQNVHVFGTDTTLWEVLATLDDTITSTTITIGVIGATPTIFSALQTGRIQFALDPQWYMEGYLPIALLAHEGQLQTWAIETQPTMIHLEDRPCHDNFFAVCSEQEESQHIATTTRDASRSKPLPVSWWLWIRCIMIVVLFVVI